MACSFGLGVFVCSQLRRRRRQSRVVRDLRLAGEVTTTTTTTTATVACFPIARPFEL